MDKVEKLQKLLAEDADFREKFEKVFDTEEKMVFQVIKDNEQVRYTNDDGCNCLPYLCGSGCFASYPGAKGHVVG